MSDIIVAPFSNSNIRDWPADHYAEMIRHLLDMWDSDGRIRVVGTRNQRLGACEVVRNLPVARVLNDCGVFPWSTLVRLMREAACVIGNNSGLAHLSGYLGVPTVCVFGGSHQRLEWRPLGETVMLVSRVIGCSPCQLDHNGTSPYNKACLREIQPASVASAAMQIMALVRDRRAQQGEAQ